MCDNYAVIRTIKRGETKYLSPRRVSLRKWNAINGHFLVVKGQIRGVPFNFTARRQVEACSSSRMD